MLPGDPAQRDLWDAFDQVLSLRFDHPCGQELEIAAACVDSGFHQPIVQQFCSERLRRSAAPKMYPIKGAAGQRPIWPRMHSKAKDNRPLWVIGVDAAKEALYARLKITEPGPGFCHFPISDQYDLGYFEQLTAETCRVRYSKGFAHREWTKKPGARNEALDARCYAYAALQSLIAGRFRLNKQAEQIEALMAAKAGGEDAPTAGRYHSRPAAGSANRGSSRVTGSIAVRIPDPMEPCIQSAAVTSACLICGGRAEKMHRPVFHRGSFCPRCCPVCAPKLVGAQSRASSPPATRPTQSAAEGATQWKDAGWGPRADDPFYHDRERHDRRPRWVPHRPHWFR